MRGCGEGEELGEELGGELEELGEEFGEELGEEQFDQPSSCQCAGQGSRPHSSSLSSLQKSVRKWRKS